MPEPVTPAAPAAQPAAVPAAPAAPAAPAPSGTPAGQQPPAGEPPKDDFKSEESKRAVLADLAKEREERKALKAELESLAPLKQLAAALAGGDGKESGPTDVEKLTERLKNHEDDLSKERDLRWRAEVASVKNLTPGQAARLVGTTKEELLADADEFLKDLPTPKGDEKRTRGPVVDRSGTGSGNADNGSLAAGAAAYQARKGKTKTN